jgi:hypothetical protein
MTRSATLLATRCHDGLVGHAPAQLKSCTRQSGLTASRARRWRCRELNRAIGSGGWRRGTVGRSFQLLWHAHLTVWPATRCGLIRIHSVTVTSNSVRDVKQNVMP